MNNQVLTGLNVSMITKVFNKAIVPQIANAIILGIAAFILDKTMYINGHGTMVTEIAVGTAMTHIIVGGFFYVPGLVMINIINWIMHPAIKNG